MSELHETLTSTRKIEANIVRFINRILHQRRLLEINHRPDVTTKAAEYFIPQIVYGSGSEHAYRWGKPIYNSKPVVSVMGDGTIEVFYSSDDEKDIDLFYISKEIMAGIMRETRFDPIVGTEVDFGATVLSWVQNDVLRVEQAAKNATSFLERNT